MKRERWSRRVLRGAVRTLLPRESRAELGGELVRVGTRLLDDARERGGRAGEARALARELASLTALAARERIQPWRDMDPRREWTGMLGHDVRFAVRMMWKSPVSTGVSLLTLALGIGAVTAVFSVVNGVLLDPLAYAEPERVVMVGELGPGGGYASLSWENFRDWQESDAFEAVALWVGNSVSVSGDGPPERIRGLFVTASYFDVVGVRPVLGRALEPGEDRPGGPRVAVLSWGWWQERFGGDPEVLGRTVRLNNEPHTVVGVMPRGFRSPFDTPSAWISLHTAPRTFDRSSRQLSAMALLREGDDVDDARARLERVAAGLAERYPDANAGWSAWAIRLDGWVSGRYQPLLLSLLVSVGVLLLIAGANVAGLQVARTAARTRELAVRSALGGSATRLTRQLLVENGLLTALGGAAGIGLAFLGVDALMALGPPLDRFFDVTIDGRVLAAGIGTTAVAALGFGLLPALTAGRGDPGALLSERRSGARGAPRARAVLVVSQVALSLALLVSAGLLVRSMRALGRVDPGFDTERLLTAEFRLTGERYDTDEAKVAFFDQVVARVAALPGVEGVTTSQNLPFGDRGDIPFVLEGTEPDLERAPRVDLSRIMPGFPQVMGLELVRGRGLDPAAGPGDPLEALVSERTAEELIPGDDPLGRAFYVSEDLRVARIVGVVSDVSVSLTDGPERSAYINQRQMPAAFSSLAVRTRGEPMEVAQPLREAVWAVDPDQPVWEVMPITDRMAATVGDRRFGMTLLSFFGALAVLLAGMGIYGVVSYAVGARSRELGLRMALGAARGEVLRLVLRRAAVLVAIGLALGMVAAWWSASLLEAVLFGVSSHDPVSFGVAAAVLGGVALVAAWIPARRATRLDPAATLQET